MDNNLHFKEVSSLHTNLEPDDTSNVWCCSSLREGKFIDTKSFTITMSWLYIFFMPRYCASRKGKQKKKKKRIIPIFDFWVLVLLDYRHYSSRSGCLWRSHFQSWFRSCESSSGTLNSRIKVVYFDLKDQKMLSNQEEVHIWSQVWKCDGCESQQENIVK